MCGPWCQAHGPGGPPRPSTMNACAFNAGVGGEPQGPPRRCGRLAPRPRHAPGPAHTATKRSGRACTPARARRQAGGRRLLARDQAAAAASRRRCSGCGVSASASSCASAAAASASAAAAAAVAASRHSFTFALPCREARRGPQHAPRRTEHARALRRSALLNMPPLGLKPACQPRRLPPCFPAALP